MSPVILNRTECGRSVKFREEILTESGKTAGAEFLR
jgi:hypothetical protein